MLDLPVITRVTRFSSYAIHKMIIPIYLKYVFCVSQIVTVFI